MGEKLTDWENKFQSLLRARQPGIVAQSIEEPRVLSAIVRALQWMAEHGLGTRKLTRWSSVSTESIDILNPNKKPAPPEHLEFFGTLNRFTSPDDQEDDDHDREGRVIRRAVLVLADCGPELEQPSNVRKLRETLWKIRGTTQSIILVGKPFELPDEIANDLTIVPFELPTAANLQASLEPLVHAYKEAVVYKNLVIDASIVPALARACAGLTETESRGILGLAIAQFEALDNRAVHMALKEKANIVRRSNVLEYKTCDGGLQNVGGLEHVKAWIREQDSILGEADAAASFGLRMPSGLCLLGVPGTGKSLMAEMLAAHWQLPLLFFDVSRAFGSLVGQSEANIDQVIALAKACSPCVVFIDEIEKALGGTGGEMDGGTSSRVTGKLLTWLQNKPDGVFIVATANDVTKFESRPEMLRAGRFDKLFFVDLPDMRSRLEILAIHYRKAVERAKARGACSLEEAIAPDILMPAARTSKGYSGAELEVAMQTALRAGFNTQPRLSQPTAAMLVEAVKSMKPLSATMKESIKALRAWVADGRAAPAGATLEDDAKDAQALEAFGLPDVLANARI